MRLFVPVAIFALLLFAVPCAGQAPGGTYVGQPVVQMIQVLGQPTVTTDIGNGAHAMTFRQKRNRRTFDGTAIVNADGVVQSYTEKEVKMSGGQRTVVLLLAAAAAGLVSFFVVGR